MLSSIYLTGGNLEAQGAVGQIVSADWRSQAATKLQRYGLQVVNPLELAWHNIDANHPLEISGDVDVRVRRALDLIDQSDALLANIGRSSYATAMEIFYAHRRGKTVTVIGQSPFSPWVLSHSQARFEDVDHAIDYLLDEKPQAAPVNWALQYEAQLSERYEQFPPAGEPDYRFMGGEIPVLTLAPHATGYWREGEFYEPDTFTGSLSAVLHRLTKCHSLLTFYCCAADPAWHLETPLRRALADTVKAGQIGLVVILLGSTWHQGQALQIASYGSDKSVSDDYASRLRFKLGDLEPVSQEDHSDYALPLARFTAYELNVPVMVVRLHKRYRMPRLQLEAFSQVTTKLAEFINEAGGELIRGLK